MRIGIIRVLIGIDADRISRASNLDTGAGSGAIARRARLDIVRGKGRADEAGAGAVEIAEVPVEPDVAHGVLELQDAVVEGVVGGDLDARAFVVRDPVEVEIAR